MNCFKLIKTVLDEAYQAIPGNDAEKDKAIAAALKELSAEYKKLQTKGCLSYTDPARRFAYLYRYTTSHANFVYSVLSGSTLAAKYFSQSELQLAAIGGGPGSDFLGVLKYCAARGFNPTMKCLLFDRDPAWGESWQDVDAKAGGKIQLKTFFQTFDVTEPSTYQFYVKHFASDIFTLVYFMSEVYALRGKAKPYFDALFGKAKKDALFIFIDNNHGDFTGWFDSLAAKHGVAIREQKADVLKLPWAEEKSDLGVFVKKFEPPKLKADLAYRIAVKQ
ncbi:MAG: hypothetical protein AB1705_08110 [Verrucomicrobiota bacterium]